MSVKSGLNHSELSTNDQIFVVLCFVDLHPCIICFKWSQLGAHYFLVYLFQLLYMFRATMCPSSGEITVSMRHWYFSLFMRKRWKVKWSRYRPGVARSVGRGITLLYHDRGTRRVMSGQQQAPAALHPRERHCTHFTGSWVGHRAGLDGRKISSPLAYIPDRPARSQSLYRLS